MTGVTNWQGILFAICAYGDGILSRGLLPLIPRPTRICSTTASIIDHMITNDIMQHSVSGIILTDVDDHFGAFNFTNNTKTHNTNMINNISIFSENNI